MRDDTKDQATEKPEKMTDDDRMREEWNNRHLAHIERLKSAGLPTDHIERLMREGIPPGDQADELTPEDEEILDRIWAGQTAKK